VLHIPSTDLFLLWGCFHISVYIVFLFPIYIVVLRRMWGHGPGPHFSPQSESLLSLCRTVRHRSDSRKPSPSPRASTRLEQSDSLLTVRSRFGCENYSTNLYFTATAQQLSTSIRIQVVFIGTYGYLVCDANSENERKECEVEGEEVVTTNDLSTHG